MRIRGSKTAMKEMGLDTDGMANSTAKLRDEVLKLSGVDIMQDRAGTKFKSTFDILEGLAGNWKQMSDIDRANVTELIAGKRQGNIVASLMDNFDVARQAMNASKNSKGSADAELAKYQESIEGRLATLKSTWQSFSTGFLESGAIKTGISGLTGVLGVVNKLTGALGSLGSISLGAGLFGMFKSGALSNVATGLGMILNKTASIKEVFGKGGLAGISKFATGSLITAGVVTAVSALNGYFNSVKDNYESRLKNTYDSSQKYQKSYDNYAQKMPLYSGKSRLSEAENEDLSNSIVGMANSISDVNEKEAFKTKINQASAFDSYGKNMVQIGKIASEQAYKEASKSSEANLKLIQSQQTDAWRNQKWQADISTSKGNALSNQRDLDVAQHIGQNLGDLIKYGNTYGKDGKTVVQLDTSSEEAFIAGYNKIGKELDSLNSISDINSNMDDYKNMKELLENPEVKDAYDRSIKNRFDKAIAGYGMVNGMPKSVKEQMDMFKQMSAGFRAETRDFETKRLAQYLDDKFGVRFTDARKDDEYLAKAKTDQVTRQEMEDHATKRLYDAGAKSLYNSLDDAGKELARELIFKTHGRGVENADMFKRNLALMQEGQDDDITSMDKFVEKMGVGQKEGLATKVSDYVKNMDNLGKAFTKMNTNGLSLSEKMDMAMSDPMNLAPALTNNKKFREGIKASINKQNEDMIRSIDNVINSPEMQDSPAGREAFKIIRDQVSMIARHQTDFNTTDELGKLQNMTTALTESGGTSGVSMASYENLSAMFSELDGYNPDKLFDKTALGLRINTREMANLQREYEGIKRQKIADQISETSNKIQDMNKEIASLDPSSAKDATRINALKEGLVDYNSELQRLQATQVAFEASNNAMTRWQNTIDDDQIYNAVSGGWNEAKNKMGNRVYGDAKTNAYIDMLSRKDMRGASPSEYVKEWESLNKTIGETGYSLGDFFSEDDNYTGARNFADAVNQIDSSLGKMNSTTGSYDWNLTAQQFDNLAQKMGVSTEALQTFFDAQAHHGSEVHIGKSIDTSNVEKAKQQLHGLEEEVVKLGGTPLKLDADMSNLQSIESNLSKVKETYDSLKSKKDSGFELSPIETAQLDEATAKIEMLVSAKQKLNEPAIMKIDTSGMDAEMSVPIQKIQEMHNLLNQKELQVELGADTSEVDSKLLEVASQILALDPEIRARFGIEGTTPQQILDEIAGRNYTVPVNVQAHTESAQDAIQALDGTEVAVKIVTEIENRTNPIDWRKPIDNTTINGRLGISPPNSTPTLPTTPQSDTNKTVTVNVQGQDKVTQLKADMLAIYDRGVVLTVTTNGYDQVQKVKQDLLAIYDRGVQLTVTTTGQDQVQQVKQDMLAIYDRGVVLTVTASGQDQVAQVKNDLLAVYDRSVFLTVDVAGLGGVEMVKSGLVEIYDRDVVLNVTVNGLGEIESAQDAMLEIYDRDIIANIVVSGLDSIQSAQSALLSIYDRTVICSVIVSGLGEVQALYGSLTMLYDRYIQAICSVSGVGEVYSLYAGLVSLYDRYVSAVVSVSDGGIWSAVAGINSLYSKVVTVTVVYNQVGSPPAMASGTARVNGTTHGNSYAQGTAYNNGSKTRGDKLLDKATLSDGRPNPNWTARSSSMALMGELGSELVVRNGQFFTVGDTSAQFFPVRKNDIIFDHKQTEQILKTGRISSGKKRGRALASGTVPTSGRAYASGNYKYTSDTLWSTKPTTSGGMTTLSSIPKKEKKEKDKDFKEAFDWIEVLIERVESAINILDKKAGDVFSGWETRGTNLALQMKRVNDEIAIQQNAMNKYAQYANSVSLAENYKDLVRNGTMDISIYRDEDLVDKIKDFSEYYNKMVKARDAVEELKLTEKELAKVRFENIVDKYEGYLGILESNKELVEEYINQTEESGYAVSMAYYSKLIATEKDNISAMSKERAELNKVINENLANGSMTKDSEAFLEMAKQVNDITLEMEKANTAIIEYNNNIRKTKWDTFDNIADRVSKISDETEFLVELLSQNENLLFDDKGNASNEAQTIKGLHAVNYNVAMAQADKYAKEVMKLNADIAKDPSNNELIERRNELLEKQRESILMAQEEKKSIVELVSQGIEKEIDSMNELIEKYSDALNSQKDLFEYSRDIKERTKEIEDLTKMKLAYQNDTSDEAKMKLQKIQVELDKSREALEETQYDKYIDDQKKLLDELAIKYEEVMNSRLDNVDELISQEINDINANSAMIAETLNKKVDEVGYTLTNEMNSILNSGSGLNNIVSMYGDNFISTLNTTNSVLTGIDTSVNTLIEKMNVLVDQKLNPKEPEKPENPTTPTKPTTPVKPEPTTGVPQTPTVGGKYILGNSVNKYMNSDNAKNKTNSVGSYGAGDYTVYKIANGMINITKKAGQAGAWINPNDNTYRVGGSATNPTANTGNIFEPKKSDTPKSELNWQYSIVDRLKYRDLDSSFSARSRYYSKLGLGSNYQSTPEQNMALLKQMKLKGYRNGVFNLSKSQLAWTQEAGLEAILSPSLGMLTPLEKGSSVLNHNATKTLFDFANSPKDFIDILSPNTNGIINNNTSADVDLQIILPNVMNYDQFKEAMIKDNNLQTRLKAGIVDTMFGKSGHRKY